MDRLIDYIEYQRLLKRRPASLSIDMINSEKMIPELAEEVALYHRGTAPDPYTKAQAPRAAESSSCFAKPLWPFTCLGRFH